MPEKWLVLGVRVPSAERRAEVAASLIALGGSAVEETGERLQTYLPPPDDAERFVRGALAELRARVPGTELGIEWRWQAHEDWSEAWRRGLRPRRVGRRLVIAPTWTDPEPEPAEIVIRIDPQMAFGTGEHATTRGVLRLLEAAILPGDRVLDVGTGSGVLAIAAAKLGATSVMAVESDADAVINARENLARNDVAGRVELIEARVDDTFFAGLGPGRFDLIVANVLSGVLVPLLPALHAAIGERPGRSDAGRIILGGILTTETHRVRAAADAARLAATATDVEDEWWSALLEPYTRPA